MSGSRVAFAYCSHHLVKGIIQAPHPFSIGKEAQFLASSTVLNPLRVLRGFGIQLYISEEHLERKTAGKIAKIGLYLQFEQKIKGNLLKALLESPRLLPPDVPCYDERARW